MAYDIGPKIGVEGEKEFKKAITDINKDLTVLGSELKKVSAQFDGNANSLESLTAKQEVYNKRADEQRKKIEVMTAALENAKKEYGENSDQVKNWQIKLNNAEADLAKTENALKQTTEQMNNLGKETDQTADKQEEFGKKIEATGGKVNEFASKALLALAAAAAAAGAALFKLTVDAGKFADELITTSNQTGISTQQLQEWDYAMRFIDVDMNTMTGSMAKLVKNMDNAAKGTKDQVEAFDALGVSFSDGNGELRDSRAVFMEIIDALGEMENETQRDALAMRLFGRSAQELNPLIKAGAGELARLSEEAHNVGAVLDDDAIKALGEFDDNMQVLEASIKGVTNKALAELTPYINQLIDALREKMPAIVENIKGFVKFVIDNGPTIIGVIGGIAGGLLAWNVVSMVQKLAGAIKGWQLATEGMTVAQRLLNIAMAANPIGIIVSAIAGLVTAILVLWHTNDDFRDAVINMGKQIKEFFLGLVEWAKYLPLKFKGIGIDIVKGVWEGIKSMASWFKEQISGFFSNIVGGVKEALGIASPSKVFAGIGENMAAGLGVGFAKEMNSVSKKINTSIPSNVQMNGSYDTKQVEGLVNGIASIVGGGQTIIINPAPVILNGKTVAQVMFEPLQNVARQKGVALA
jgi:methyl-accepting chemotaxis protein